MKKEIAIQVARDSAVNAHGFMCKSLDSCWTTKEKFHWVCHAKTALSIGLLKFLETNTHHDHSELFLPLTQALQSMHMSINPQGVDFSCAWDAKKQLEEILRLCSTLSGFLSPTEGGAA